VRLALDTDVVIAALRSPGGASAALLLAALDGRVDLLVSVPLALEYEAVALRPEQHAAMGMTAAEAERRISTIIALCIPVPQSYRWRPQTVDPNDEMVLETAINGGADAIVTFNSRDFGLGPATFGIAVLTPAQALRKVRS
jgi:putative PIN family toxin of toxin-antitoxin system